MREPLGNREKVGVGQWWEGKDVCVCVCVCDPVGNEREGENKRGEREKEETKRR